MSGNYRPGGRVADSDLKACNRCGAGNLVWHRSTRTGRPYLADTQKSRSGDIRYAVPSSPHRCEDYLARLAKHVQHDMEIQVTRELVELMRQPGWLDRNDHMAWRDARLAELLAEWNTQSTAQV